MPIKPIHHWIPIMFCLLSFATVSKSKVVDYRLNVSEQRINISGKEAVGISINHSIPGPTLKAKVGDTLRIEVTNHLDTETSIHWHGVLVPNRMDGVPYVTTPPIAPGKSFVYEFPVRHSGTFWYHAHSALQEQQGVYGSIAFYPEHEANDYDEEHVLVLSDWTDENPDQVLANIKRDPDYYALKKDSVQSWLRVLENGSEAIKIRFNNALNKMGPMDLSDIGYDAFLINGAKTSNLSHAKPGTRVKLRIINAAASSYFILEYSGGPLKVIESDGVAVEPFTAQRIRMAMAETYDVIVTIPDNKAYEFRASAEDGTGFAVAHLGHGALVRAPVFPKPNLVLMGMAGMDHGSMGSMPGMEMDHAAHQGMQMDMAMPAKKKSAPKNKVAAKSMESMPGMDHSAHEGMQMSNQDTTLRHVNFLNTYKDLKATSVTTLPPHNPPRTITLRLTGSMERYVWTINETPMYAADKIIIKKGENVKVVLKNETMMHHPIHLHGHFFRILNGQGDYSPLKHTVNVAPFETVELEFEANEEKDWIFHCHNLYHMKLGMGGIIHYEGTESSMDLMTHHSEHSAEHGNQWFTATEFRGFSNFAEITTQVMKNNDYVILDARHNYKKDYDAELSYKKYVSQFVGIYAGGRAEHERNDISHQGIVGMEYTLPLLIKADLRINTEGETRLGLGNQHQLSDRVSLDWKWNTDKEYTVEVDYTINKQLYVSGNYDSREKFGVGLSLKF